MGNIWRSPPTACCFSLRSELKTARWKVDRIPNVQSTFAEHIYVVNMTLTVTKLLFCWGFFFLNFSLGISRCLSNFPTGSFEFYLSVCLTFWTDSSAFPEVDEANNSPPLFLTLSLRSSLKYLQHYREMRFLVKFHIFGRKNSNGLSPLSLSHTGTAISKVKRGRMKIWRFGTTAESSVSKIGAIYCTVRFFLDVRCGHGGGLVDQMAMCAESIRWDRD